MKVREAIKRLEREGWSHVRTKSSHRIFKKVGEVNSIVIPGKDGEDISTGVLADIKRKAGW